MMYTPTPSNRRPRPPSRVRPNVVSLPDHHQPPSNKAHSSSPHQTQTQTHGSSSSVSSRSILQNGPSSPSHIHIQYNRRPPSRAELSRISASPQEDIGDISTGLDIDMDSAQLSSTMPKRRPVGLGLPSPLGSRNNLSSSEAEPSPPPPYGSKLPSSGSVPDVLVAPTPLRQDSGSSRRSVVSPRGSSADGSRLEERLRARRATDAAKAMGLEVDFGTSGSEARERTMDSEEDLSENTMRIRLLEMKRQLRRRDTELLVAAEVAERALQTHEELLQYLPSTVKARLPNFVHLFPGQADHKRMSSRSGSDSSTASRTGSHLREASSRSPLSVGTSTTGDFAHTGHAYSETDYREVSEMIEYSTGDDASTPSRRFRTVRANDLHRPYPQHHAKNSRRHLAHSISSRQVISPRQAQLTAVQQEEADLQILALEQALNDAREGEENQRKLAARLRREVDKLHREFERAEADSSVDKIESITQVGTPGVRGGMEKAICKPRPAAVPAKVAIRPTPKKRDSFGWGSIAFPQFPAGSAKKSSSQPQEEDEGELDLGEVSDRLRRVSPDGKRHKILSPALSRVSSLFSAISQQDSPPRMSTIRNSRPSSLARQSTEKLSLPREGRKVRKKLSQTNFLDPSTTKTSTPRRRSRSPTPLKPRLTVEAPDSSPPAQSDSSRGTTRIRSSNNSRTIRKSPWPSPHESTMSTGVSPDSRNMQLDPDSLSPAFASISSRMAAMSAFVSSALQTTPSRPGITRTLGSELGSEYGDRADGSLRMIEDALFLTRPSPSRTHLSVDDDGRSVFSDGFCDPPAPLPPRVSAALSSLALALAPYASPNPPEAISGLPESAYAPRRDDDNIFDEAFAMRKIRWADTTKTSVDLSTNEHFISESVFTVQRSTSSPRPSKTFAISPDAHTKIARPRPPHLRHSSDGSISLAHRRRISQQIIAKPSLQTSKSYPSTMPPDVDEDDEGVWEVILEDSEEGCLEPRTIPGRLVHDLICLMAILVDFVECAVVIIYRVVLDMRYGRRDGLLGAKKRAQMRRFYL